MVVDSNGGRVFELDEDGEIIWQVEIKGAYDVERFHVPVDEASIRTASKLGPTTSVDGDNSARDSVPEPRDVPKGSIAVLEGILPSVVLNGLLYVLPPWFGVRELAITMVVVTVGIVWTGAELRWRGYRLRSPLEKRDR